MSEIILDHIDKSYGRTQVLFDVDLSIPEGSIFGLIGPSGGGKTTIVKIITGLLEPESGNVSVLGQKMPAKTAVEDMGYMAQAAALYTMLTGRENLEFFGKLYGLKGEKLKERIDHVARLVNLQDELGKPVMDYSGGMKQRLSLATALIHDPKVLILDEPTVGIDPLLRREIWRELRELANTGVTIIITTHVMDEAGKCDRLAMISEGRILSIGTAEELIEKAGAKSFEDAFIAFGKGEAHED